MKKSNDNRSEEDILYELLSKKTKAIDPNKVFYVGASTDGNIIYRLAGKKLPDNVASQLRTEAQVIKKMTLWKILTETLRHETHQRMFEKMVTLDDAHYGKTMLHSIGVFETIVDKLCEMKSTQPNPHVYGRKPTPTELSTT